MSRSQSTHRQAAGGNGGRSRQSSHAQSSPAPPASGRNGTDDSDRERRGGGHNGGSTKHIPCKFFKHGHCSAGASCSFSHDINSFVEKAPCKYFHKGNCKYGNKCALLHTLPPQENGFRQVTGSSRQPHGGSAKESASLGKSSGSRMSLQARRASAAPALGSAKAAKEGKSVVDSESKTRSRTIARSDTSNEERNADGSTNSSTSTGAKTDDEHSTSADDVVSVRKGSVGSPQMNQSGGGRLGQSTGVHRKTHPAMRVDSGMAEFGDGDDDEHFDPAAFFHSRNQSPSSLFASPSLAGDGSTGETAVGIGITHSYAGLASVGSPLNPRSQPIPKPRLGGRRMGGGGSGADHLSPIQTGLSPQDSTLIDKLSISNSVNHNSLSGSPFLSSSIPLLDQFRDSSLSARDSPGLHPFARSPVSNGGIELTRHAFTSVEMAGIVSSADNGGIDSAGSLRSGHYFGHHHHHHQHHHISYLQSVSSLSAGVDSHDSSRDGTPAVNPIGSSRSAAAMRGGTSDIIGRSVRSSSLIGEKRSPLATLSSGDLFDRSPAHPLFPASSLATPISPLTASTSTNNGFSPLPNRQRSSTQIPTTPLLRHSPMAAFDSGNGTPAAMHHGMQVRSGAAFSTASSRDGLQAHDYSSLLGMHSLPNESAFLPFAHASRLADSPGPHPTIDTNLGYNGGRSFNDPYTVSPLRPPQSFGGLAASASQRTSANYTPQGNKSGQHMFAAGLWSTSGAASNQASGQSSPYIGTTRAANGGRHFPAAQMAPGTPTSATDGVFGFGQRQHIGAQQQQQHGGSSGGVAAVDYTNGGLLSGGLATRGSNSSTSISNATGHSSGNRSSAASDVDGNDPFELETETAVRPLLNGGANAAPKPAFISRQVFAHKFSGLSVDQVDQPQQQKGDDMSAIAQPPAN